jgi:4-amino-4-deoxy-L-arabinose transferase-like glycosyltransferase
VVGSAITNILGAFSLGLLFSSTARDGLEVDTSSVRYTILQLGVTVVAAIALGLQKHLRLRVVGIGLIVLFIVYIGSIFWAIRKGLVHGPELIATVTTATAAKALAPHMARRRLQEHTVPLLERTKFQDKTLIRATLSRVSATHRCHILPITV